MGEEFDQMFGMGEVKDDEEIELTDEFKAAFDLVENTADSVFITGDAGTGKSTWLKYFLKETDKQVVVTAPTGLAAVNVGGQTLHSFFGFPAKPMTPEMMKRASSERMAVYEAIDAIVIDEISMVRSDFLDCIDAFLRINRNNMFVPFGGVQLIMIGDLNQLPPVVASDMERRLLMSYRSRFFFHAKVWMDTDMHKIKFTKNFRQKDKHFIDILNNLKYGAITMQDLNGLNERSGHEYKHEEGTIILTTINKTADNYNREQINALDTKVYSFRAMYEGKMSNVKNMIPDILEVKVGAQVMFINNDSLKRWKNGTTGQVTNINNNTITVRMKDGKHYDVQRNVWETSNFKHDQNKNTIESEKVGSVKQFPLKLAWAISIHKSQGQTYDRVLINFGSGAFESGQAYVAISRCRTLEGIHFSDIFMRNNIIYNKIVMDFLKSFDKEAATAAEKHE